MTYTRLPRITTLYCVLFFILSVTVSCSTHTDTPEEQISVSSSSLAEDNEPFDPADTLYSVHNDVKVLSEPQRVVLTGMPQHRLVILYKSRTNPGNSSREQSSYYRGNYDESEYYQHFMPGIDLIYGYNLLNVMHYDLTTEKLNGLFDHPVLIKSLYYPSFEQDSIEKKPVNRDYYLITAYDVDTNADTLLNRKDLRHMYYFNAGGTQKIQLIPADHSVERSQYDWKNDVMYVFARHDADKNGHADKKKEPLHVFWFDLKKPDAAKRMY